MCDECPKPCPVTGCKGKVYPTDPAPVCVPCWEGLSPQERAMYEDGDLTLSGLLTACQFRRSLRAYAQMKETEKRRAHRRVIR